MRINMKDITKDKIQTFFGNLAAATVVTTGVLLVLGVLIPPVFVFYVWYFKMWADALEMAIAL